MHHNSEDILLALSWSGFHFFNQDVSESTKENETIESGEYIKHVSDNTLL